MTKVSITVEEGAIAPAKGSKAAGAFDLFANIKEPITIHPGKAVLIPTGIKMDMGGTTGLNALIIPRSGLGHKQGLVMGNGVGLIDNDYRGELKVSACNRNPAVEATGMGFSTNGKDAITIEPGMKLAQLMFISVPNISLNVVADEAVTETERGEGGFGSTGV